MIVYYSAQGSKAGISLSTAYTLTNLLNRTVRNSADTELYMNSVDRIVSTTSSVPSETLAGLNTTGTGGVGVGVCGHNSYLSKEGGEGNEVPSDEELVASGWPWNGGITFVNASMRYREDFDPVLKGVSVSISPGESVGIVGRTGSGKSTLFRVLLRLSELEAGQILIDGVDIARIGLDTLRSRISIIPQDAVLFSGSIRMNLDPFLQHGDEELWTALRKAHALGMIAGLPGGLSFQVSEGGENFSAGQRQQLCLAR